MKPYIKQIRSDGTSNEIICSGMHERDIHISITLAVCTNHHCTLFPSAEMSTTGADPAKAIVADEAHVKMLAYASKYPASNLTGVLVGTSSNTVRRPMI